MIWLRSAEPCLYKKQINAARPFPDGFLFNRFVCEINYTQGSMSLIVNLPPLISALILPL